MSRPVEHVTPSLVHYRPPLKPRRVVAGQTIGLVSPAGWMDPEKLDRAVKILERQGFIAYVHPQNELRQNHFAGSTQQRVEALHSLFLDDEIQGILAVQGGYGTDHLLDLVDYEVIRSHPKCFIGYSDVTSLLHAFWVKAGIVTFHGPMLHSFASAADPFTLRHLTSVLGGQPADRTAITAVPPDIRVLRAGSGSGLAMGGNLTALTRLIGTPYEVDTSGAILLIEDVDEQLYTLDRMFMHLRQAGKLNGLAGLVIAEFVDTRASRIAMGRTIEEVVLGACDGTTFPIVFGFPCGHGRRQATFPLGIRVRLDVDGESVLLTFEEAPVS